MARAGARVARWLAVVVVMILGGVSARAGDVVMPQPGSNEPITISARRAQRWIQGEYEVWVLSGECRIAQGAQTAAAAEGVVWLDRTGPLEVGPQKVIAYLEGQIRVEHNAGDQTAKLTDETWWLGRYATVGTVAVQVPEVTGAPDAQPPIYQRGMARRMPEAAGAIRRTQYSEFTTDQTLVPIAAPPPGTRRFRIHPRSNVWPQVTCEPDGPGNRWIAVINYGVNVIVEGLGKDGLAEVIDISADRVVVWTVGPENFDLAAGPTQGDDVPLEFYMEGNIVFREGRRVIHADRMYYDVRDKVGMVLGAEMLTPLPKYEGKVRLKTEVLQQVSENQFYARNSFLTSSRLGKPSYRVQLGDVSYVDSERPVIDPFTQTQVIDPETMQPAVVDQKLASGHDALLYMGDVPVFYWPFFAADLHDPTFYIRRARLKNDQIFGTQVLTNWDGYQLLGRRRPPGTDWDVSIDYLSKRGLGHGTSYLYDVDGFWIFPGRTSGLADFWGIQDKGHDNLGRGQRDLIPEKNYRWRLFWQHRQMLPADWRLSTEVGWISDRNFLEQYFRSEWDELKDESTGLELKRRIDNMTFSITGDARVNSFFTQTEWFPRVDHYWLGQSLLGDVLTWHEHSDIGYARYGILSYPENPAQQATFRYMPWESAQTQGERLVTTQEIDWPFQLGPVKTVPYALGQLAHWGEDLSGNDLQRAYWQAGIRSSMPMWRVNPEVESALWNVHGLAHKVVFDVEFSVAESNRDLDVLPLYDALDDDSIEFFRRRMPAVTYNTQGLFPNPIPARFDPRYYAVRTGLAGWVTSPSAEVVDDLMAMRMGMRHRWQTKRGVPGRRKIIDWITLDTNATWFPDAKRDNYDESLGLVDYGFRWHVGDRLTMVSEGMFDFFDDAQQLVTIGGFLSRPPRGNFYAGLRLLRGPIDSNIFSVAYNYWMSPKWVSTFGTSVDLGGNGNIGQQFSITRIGEAMLISAGFNVDASQDNVGVMFAVEPRFLPKNRLGHSGGVQIPVAGSNGLE